MIYPNPFTNPHPFQTSGEVDYQLLEALLRSSVIATMERASDELDHIRDDISRVMERLAVLRDRMENIK